MGTGLQPAGRVTLAFTNIERSTRLLRELARRFTGHHFAPPPPRAGGGSVGVEVDGDLPISTAVGAPVRAHDGPAR
jgi:hypothetical protein